MGNEDLNALSFEERLISELNQKNKKFQAIAWGKLGGRPKKEVVKSERINLRFTPIELEELKQRAEQEKLNTTDYCRQFLLNNKILGQEIKRKLPKFEEDFARISGYMKIGIFNENEKADLVVVVRTLAYKIESEITQSREHDRLFSVGQTDRITIKHIKKSIVKTLRFTPSEMAEIFQESERAKLKPTQYCRTILFGIKIPDAEKNQILTMYYNNFSRISNYMKMKIFTEKETYEMNLEINKLQNFIKEYVEW